MNYKETAVLYLVCVLTFILSGFLLFSKNISRRLYLLTIIAILCIEGAYIGIRWFDTGHPPIFGTFEATLCASWMLILFSVLIDRKAQFARIVIPIAALTLFYGLNFDKTGKHLVISEQSYWVYFHALLQFSSIKLPPPPFLLKRGREGELTSLPTKPFYGAFLPRQ